MASRLSIENDRLKVGQIKRVTSNNGNKIDSITLLLNESVEVYLRQMEIHWNLRYQIRILI